MLNWWDRFFETRPLRDFLKDFISIIFSYCYNCRLRLNSFNTMWTTKKNKNFIFFIEILKCEKKPKSRSIITFRNSEINSISFHLSIINTTKYKKGLSNIFKRATSQIHLQQNWTKCMIAKYLIIPSSLFQVNISINYWILLPQSASLFTISFHFQQYIFVVWE